MTNKLEAVATIKFYTNKHIEVELDTIKGVNPRMLSIAGNILNKTYRQMRNKHNAAAHRQARKEAVNREVDEAEAIRKFHEEEDKRLAEAAAKEAEITDKDTVETEEGEGTEKVSENPESVNQELIDAIMNSGKSADETEE